MYTEAFESFTEQAEKTVNPIVKFNKLMAKNVAQLTELQLNAMCTYANMGVSQIKAAAEVKDVASLVSFNCSQLSMLTKIFKQVSEDNKKLHDIAQEFKSELDSLVSGNDDPDEN